MFSPSGSHTILVSQHQTSWQYSNQNPLTVASNAGGVGINRDCSRIAVYRSMTVARANNKCDNPRYSLSHRRGRISESMFITACSMHDHNETKKTKQILFVRGGKSEAELALDVLYYWSYWQTRSMARMCVLRYSTSNNSVTLKSG